MKELLASSRNKSIRAAGDKKARRKRAQSRTNPRETGPSAVESSEALSVLSLGAVLVDGLQPQL